MTWFAAAWPGECSVGSGRAWLGWASVRPALPRHGKARRAGASVSRGSVRWGWLRPGRAWQGVDRRGSPWFAMIGRWRAAARQDPAGRGQECHDAVRLGRTWFGWVPTGSALARQDVARFARLRFGAIWQGVDDRGQAGTGQARHARAGQGMARAAASDSGPKCG